MNEWNLYSALKSLQMYATTLSRELKLKQNRWTKENSLAGSPWKQSSEYLRWKRLEKEVCFKSRVNKRKVIDGENGGDDSTLTSDNGFI